KHAEGNGRGDGVRGVTEKETRSTAPPPPARRGSPLAADCLDLYREMLDRDMLVAFWEKAELGEGETAEKAARDTSYEALRALNQLRKANARVDLSGLRSAVDRLTEDSDEPIRTQAEELKKRLE